MKRAWIVWLAAALSMAGCPDDGGGSDVADAVDDGTAADEATDDDAEDDAADDDGVADEGITCPEVTPEETPETFEISSVISLIWGVPTAPYVSAGLCRYDPAYEWAFRWGSTDDCRMRLAPPPTMPSAVNLDTGEITIEINGTPLTLVPMDPTVPCYFQTDGTVPEPTPGSTIRAWSTGGADVAAFDISVTFPETIPVLTSPVDDETLTTCLPWTFEWTPGDAADVWIDVYRSLPDDSSFQVTCRPLSLSPVVWPPELTALWHADAETAAVKIGVAPQVVSTTDPPITLRVSYFDERDHVRVNVARP